MTDPLGQSQVLPYLSGLSQKGYKITLISCEKPERLIHKEAIQAICSKYHINWQPLVYTRKPPILSTMKDVRRMKKLAMSLHKKIAFDIVHCRSYIAALVGVYLKQKTGVPFIFDMRGFWANERVDGGLWRLSNPVYRRVFNYFKNKEKVFLEESAAIVSLTYTAKEEIEHWPVSSSPVTVIPCCVDTELFNPEHLNREQLEALKRKADLPANTLVLGYVGSLGTWYLLSEMLGFFKVWLKQHPASVFFFVTAEPKEMVMDEAESLGISTDKIKVISAGRHEVPYYISMMDLGIFFIKNAYSKKASSPVKQGEMMAMGVPVFCNAGVGDSDYIIQKYRSGELVYTFNAAAYSDAIRRMKEEMNHPEQIRAGAMDYFDLGAGVEAYAALYDSLKR
ncbi:glycosyltransferase family 4 protein [Rurimicrobium arvi]|uniref:Glycosyltransferase family 4 protein n=2 Tax=Rurimicrobium arvi TaxID=2049916 RepID=A0ABP8MPN2_9BACT